MDDLQPFINSYYDKEIVTLISQKYGLEPMEALGAYLRSESYRMFNDSELEMLEFSPLAMFDLWEAEQLTGNPRNSLYIRRDARV